LGLHGFASLSAALKIPCRAVSHVKNVLPRLFRFEDRVTTLS